jgi:dephospho-CoA kinase
MNIGLTGGIASGKSTVAAMLVRKGAILIDADQIAREVVMPESLGLQQVADRFGKEIVLEDGSLDRKQLGSIVFSNPTARKDLEKILHPLVRQSMWAQMQKLEADFPEKLVVVDVPLLYESQLQQHFSKVMVVYVPEKMQMERLISRDGMTFEAAELRLRAQMPIEQKKELADIVIHNEGSLLDTEQQIALFWQRKEDT